MADFSDIEAFGRQHAGCGGLTPRATHRAGGGYLLTLTCACGATLDRWITVEEARTPLPLPSKLISPAGAEPRRAAASPPAAVPTGARESAPRPVRGAAAPGLGRRSDEAIEREALEILRGVSGKRPAGRAAADRAKLESTMQTALAEHDEERTQRAAASAPPRVPWLAVLAIVVVGAAAAVYLVLQPEAPPPVATPTSAPARSADQQQRAALDEIVKSLRQLQAASTPGMSFSTYSSRVIFAKSDVDRFIDAAPAGPVRARVHEVLDIHLLASAAWRARSLDQKDLWEAVSDDPAIDLCPSVKRVVDFAVPASTASSRQSRGAVVAQSIPLLWECAGQKLTALEESLGRH